MQASLKSNLWEAGVKFNLKVDSVVMSGRNAKKPNIAKFSSNIIHEGANLSDKEYFHMVVSAAQPRIQFVSVYRFYKTKRNSSNIKK